MFGVDQTDSGSLTVDGKETRLPSPVAAIAERFAFCPEERKTDGIIGDFSVAENIALAVQAKRGWSRPISAREKTALAQRYIKALDIRPPDPDKPIKFLSGGNQQKAILARWLATDPRLLILDEPTRGIDIGAHAEILKLIGELCAEGMSLVIISSEFEELAAVANRVVVLSDRRHVAELKGEEITADNIVRAIAETGSERKRQHDCPHDQKTEKTCPQLAALVLILAANTIIAPGFLDISFQNGRLYGSLIDILVRAAPVAILSVGMTLVIATRGIDLSVGAVMAISGAFAASLIVAGYPLAIVIPAALGVGLLCGLWNGFLVAVFDLQPIIATLILMVAGRGIAQLITEGAILTFNNDSFAALGSGSFLGVPVPVLIWILAGLAVGLAVRTSALGFLIEATGINRRAAMLAGSRRTFSCSASMRFPALARPLPG